MKVTFFTNFINHHQVPVADEFFKKLGQNYTFVATMPIPNVNLKFGYPDFSEKPYLLKAFENDENYQKAISLAMSSDIVIFGAAPKSLIKERLKKNKLTFVYSERWFKKGYYILFHPKFWLNLIKNYYPYIHKHYYMLCASAFTKKDVNLLGLFINKCFKWGYFPEINSTNSNIIKKENKILTLLWVGRFLDWKHPELSIKLVNQLKNKGYSVKLEMVGDGPYLNNIKEMVKSFQLENEIAFLGSLPNNKVVDKFREADVFLFTSDRNEGWGAVLNEALANRCAVVASDEIGSVPYLLEHNINGLIFKSGNLNDLFDKVEILIKNPHLRHQFSENGFLTIKNTWNAKDAVNNFFILVDHLMNHTQYKDIKGPASKA